MKLRNGAKYEIITADDDNNKAARRVPSRTQRGRHLNQEAFGSRYQKKSQKSISRSKQ
jgi:hypothetical protein